MTEAVVSDRVAKFVLTVDRLALDVARHWLLYVNLLLGIFVLLPFAAPALMAVGATAPANAIYFIYGFLCHQLPQRSFFLFGHFGAKVSYSLEEVGRAFAYDNIFTLRQFVGNEVLGWKVAWSDRMMAMLGRCGSGDYSLPCSVSATQSRVKGHSSRRPRGCSWPSSRWGWTGSRT